jgi:hypothetical protein
MCAYNNILRQLGQTPKRWFITGVAGFFVVFIRPVFICD